MSPLTEIEIAENSVRRQLIPPDKSERRCLELAGNSHPRRAREQGVAPMRFASFDKLAINQQIASIGPFAGIGPIDSERVGIQGNALHGCGSAAVVEASLSGSCRFDDNEASLAGAKAPIAVDLTGGTIIASANRA